MIKEVKIMKKLNLLIIALVIILAACSPADVSEIDQTMPVEVTKLNVEKRDFVKSYVGVVSSNDLIKYSFKTGGIISSLPVSVGDKVVVGDLLAALDPSDLQTGASVAKSQMNAAKSQYDKALTGGSPEEQRAAELNVKKAQDAYSYATDNLAKSEILYEAGALSKSKIEGIRLEIELLKSDLEQAQQMYNQATQGARAEDAAAALANYNQAKTNYQYNLQNVKDANLRSTIDGYVVSLQFGEGELIGPGYPAVIVRSKDQVIDFGISQKDIAEIDVGVAAIVKVSGKKIDGELISIAEIPNTETGMFDAKVLFSDEEFKLGLIAELDLVIGVSEGIWVPIDNIKYSGSNYVFIAEEGKVVRKNITIEERHSGYARVSGLEQDDLLITANSNIIKPGDLIKIVES